MNDTPEDVRTRYHAMLMQRPGAERLKMGCAMFDASRALVKASLSATNETDLKIQLLRRTYENDFGSATLERIAAHLRAVQAR